MTDITLTDSQAVAVKAVARWFHQCQHETESRKPLTQQVFRLFGYAGVGKSTILKYAMDEIRVTSMPRFSGGSAEQRMEFREQVRETAESEPLVMYLAFTGKAALVMTRKGTPASTIHSAVYIVQEPTEQAIEKARRELADLQARGPAGEDVMLWRALVRDREMQIKNMHKPSFVLNVDSLVRDAALIVLDEVSMVGEEQATDLMSFRRPILVLGDPGQLPPIKGEGTFTQAEPDIMLTEIMRQAAESPIIRLATMARQGQQIPFGRYSDDVWKISRDQISTEMMLRADQVICGYNATRIALNNALKVAAGFPEPLPVGGGEKIICLKNRHSDGLVNGQFLNLVKISDPSEIAFMAEIETEDGQNVGKMSVYRGPFDDHVQLDKERDQRDWAKKKGRVECVWGWAITGHKSQGSQWSNVCVFDDGFGRGPDRNKWLYTTITRAESGLVILA